MMRLNNCRWTFDKINLFTNYYKLHICFVQNVALPIIDQHRYSLTPDQCSECLPTKQWAHCAPTTWCEAESRIMSCILAYCVHVFNLNTIECCPKLCSKLFLFRLFSFTVRPPTQQTFQFNKYHTTSKNWTCIDSIVNYLFYV